jgi:Spy/CpxP family protein refolding chaperone
MKGSFAGRVGSAIAMLGLVVSASAQVPGQMGGPGMPGPGDRTHRPPFERAFGGHGVEGRWWNNPKIIERLKLTDDQRKAFDQTLLDHRAKLIDLRANVEKAELAMEPLVQSDQPNEGAILAQIDKLAQARAELEKANARYLLALRSKLTPEQWKQVQEFRANRGREGWGPRGHRPDGPGDDRGPRDPGRDGRDGNGQPPPPPGPQGMLDDEDGQAAPPAAGAGMQQ